MSEAECGNAQRVWNPGFRFAPSGLRSLMQDEEEHIDFLETQLDLVAKIGLELYSQHHIGELEEDED